MFQVGYILFGYLLAFCNSQLCDVPGECIGDLVGFSEEVHSYNCLQNCKQTAGKDSHHCFIHCANDNEMGLCEQLGKVPREKQQHICQSVKLILGYI
jgi:hypothetical protein